MKKNIGYDIGYILRLGLILYIILVQRLLCLHEIFCQRIEHISLLIPNVVLSVITTVELDETEYHIL